MGAHHPRLNNESFITPKMQHRESCSDLLVRKPVKTSSIWVQRKVRKCNQRIPVARRFPPLLLRPVLTIQFLPAADKRSSDFSSVFFLFSYFSAGCCHDKAIRTVMLSLKNADDCQLIKPQLEKRRKASEVVESELTSTSLILWVWLD